MIRLRRYRFLVVVTFLTVLVFYTLTGQRLGSQSDDRVRPLPGAGLHRQRPGGTSDRIGPPPPQYLDIDRPVQQLPQEAPPLRPTLKEDVFGGGPTGISDIGLGDSLISVTDSESTPTATSPPVHWTSRPDRFPVSSLISLPQARAKSFPRIQHKFAPESAEDRRDRLDKLEQVRAVFRRSWHAYSTRCLGHDEIMPVSGKCNDKFNGWGATLVDSLDTLWLMDFKPEFEAAVRKVENIDFTTADRDDIPVFETTIRYLGGLLGAYDLSDHKYPILLTKAVELADVLMGAFDTPNRMPLAAYRWKP